MSFIGIDRSPRPAKGRAERARYAADPKDRSRRPHESPGMAGKALTVAEPGRDDLHRRETIGATPIFEVAGEREHRIAPVATGGPRRVFTGWFPQ